MRRVSDDLARRRVASSDARACRLSYMDSPVRPQAAKTFVCTLESYLRSYGIRLVGVRLRVAAVGRRGPDVRKLRRRNRLTVGRAVDRMVDVDGRMRSLRLRAWIVWRSDCLALTGGYGLRRIGAFGCLVKGRGATVSGKSSEMGYLRSDGRTDGRGSGLTSDRGRVRRIKNGGREGPPFSENNMN